MGETMSDDIVSQAIVKLFNSERFYAEIIAQMDRKISKKVPIAGVCVKSKIELHINPEAFEKLSPTERVAVLKHECEHILRNHIKRGRDIAPEVYTSKKNTIENDIINSMKHRAINISMDCAINGDLKDLPEWAVFPHLFNLPNGQTTEWYLNQLKDNEKAKELMEFDDHALWAESEEDSEILREKIRDAVNKAATKTRSAGQMSLNNELLVSRLNYVPKNWKNDIRRFVAKNTDQILDTSRKKRNRRYGIQYPGIIKEDRLHLGVAIDTSGSVSDEALNQFMAEIANINKYANITVVEADSEIKNVYQFDPKKQYKISGRGGTAYQPAFDFFNKNYDIDGLIYFGDMDCYDHEEIKKPSYKVIWAIVGEQKPPVEWGARTYIEIKPK